MEKTNEKLDMTIAEFRERLKRYRRDTAMLAAVFNIESDETTVSSFNCLIERIIYYPKALQEFMEEYSKL